MTCTVQEGAARPALVWVDVQTEKEGERLCKVLEGHEYRVSLHQVSGRTLQDQVWWRRWVVLGSKELAFNLQLRRNRPLRFPRTSLPPGWRGGQVQRR